MPLSPKEFLDQYHKRTFEEEQNNYFDEQDEVEGNFLGGKEHRIPGADTINQAPDVDYYHMPVFEYNPYPDAEIMI